MGDDDEPPPTYPTPDRSDFTPNRRKTADNDTVDIGWAEGVLSDGRPYRLECWAQDQVTHLQMFFSRRGLEHLDRAGIQDLLEREHLVRFASLDKRYASGKPWRDPKGQDIWSIAVVVGDEDETYLSESPALTPYPDARDRASFNPEEQ